VVLEPFNPLATALTLGATFVARVFSGDIMQSKEIIKAAIQHQGYALVDVFQPCVVFNKQNTYQWFKQNTYYLDETHDKGDKMKALALAFELERMPLGILYQVTGRPSYETLVRSGDDALHKRAYDETKLNELIKSYR
jgi:2-oxoglutarate ferredoxin oxidoreductase subunit beta